MTRETKIFQNFYFCNQDEKVQNTEHLKRFGKNMSATHQGFCLYKIHSQNNSFQLQNIKISHTLRSNTQTHAHIHTNTQTQTQTHTHHTYTHTTHIHTPHTHKNHTHTHTPHTYTHHTHTTHTHTHTHIFSQWKVYISNTATKENASFLCGTETRRLTNSFRRFEGASCLHLQGLRIPKSIFYSCSCA